MRRGPVKVLGHHGKETAKLNVTLSASRLHILAAHLQSFDSFLFYNIACMDVARVKCIIVTAGKIEL
jgi:hypothetical protein